MKSTKNFVKIAILLLGNYLWSQNIITGSVQELGTQEPLAGATLLIKDTTNGVTTDIDGRFSLETRGPLPLILIVSYMGYETQEVVIDKFEPIKIWLKPASAALNEITVTARRRNEQAQEIPIPIAVIGANEINTSISFNVNRIKELVPSVQLYSSNPRNTTLNIRGLGSTFGLTNDGIDPGVGFYVDGVYYARPAATTLDFMDIEQIEVLRGPQGTLFGKNTTSGTFNITSKRPTFHTTANFEQSIGNYGFLQSKASISGALIDNVLATRLSFSGTQRDGNIYNVATQKYTNTLNNQGFKLQLLYLPSDNTSIILSGDYSRQRPDGYAQVFAGVAPTQRADFRQFESIIADLNYDLPSRNPFDRLIDHDTPWKSDQDFGGMSLNANIRLGKGTFTSTSAWRIWKWDPSNDRDFTGLSAIAKSQAPSIHHQWSQEMRYTGEVNDRLSSVIGLFAFYQKLDPNGAHILEAGKDQWRFVQHNQDPLWETPGLLDGLTQETRPAFRNFSGALFAQIDWKITDILTFLPGLRLNYDQKKVDYESTVTGGLQTDDQELIALQNMVFSPQAFITDIDDWNISGQASLSYKINDKIRTYATYALAFKPIGLNLGGIPSENGVPLLDLAVVKPEKVNHFEVGLKSEPTASTTFNIALFNTNIDDYQTNVLSSQLGVTRGYLANAEKVRVQGFEIEWAYFPKDHIKLNGSLSYTDGKYVSFENAPVPLEETGGDAYKDISGEKLPGISKWAFSGGLELFTERHFINQKGMFFLGADVYARSGFSSSPSPSQYLNIDGYALLNGRLGFRTSKGVTVFVWGKNLADADYFEQLLPAGGNAGHYAGVLGDPKTYGITVRYNLY
ncbi:MAG TPA: TonB-dependent receptor [Aquaticitalea sp.]|nr:TonB-dependent receptor [Aquaticitalea sp.]